MLLCCELKYLLCAACFSLAAFFFIQFFVKSVTNRIEYVICRADAETIRSLCMLNNKCAGILSKSKAVKVKHLLMSCYTHTSIPCMCRCTCGSLTDRPVISKKRPATAAVAYTKMTITLPAVL